MSSARARGPVVVDTDVFSADLLPGSRLAARYAPIIAGRPVMISFQTVAELQFGALRRGWDDARMLEPVARAKAPTSSTPARISSRYAPVCESIAKRQVTRSGSPSTTPIAGSPPPRSVTTSRWSPTTGSSKTQRAHARPARRVRRRALRRAPPGSYGSSVDARAANGSSYRRSSAAPSKFLRVAVFVGVLALAANSILLVHVSCLTGFEHFEDWLWGLSQGAIPAVCEGETSIAYVLGLPDPWTLVIPFTLIAAALWLLLARPTPRG